MLVAGHDFYRHAAPQPRRHPARPGWPGTTRTCPGTAPSSGSPNSGRRCARGAAGLVAGGPDESIFQPEWSPDGALYFVSDRTGWWNLYRWRDGQTEPLCPLEAEFGQPQWVFGHVHLRASPRPSASSAAYTERGVWRLASAGHRERPARRRWTAVQRDRAACAPRPGGASSPAARRPQPPRSCARPRRRAARECCAAPATLQIDPGYLSVAGADRVPDRGRADRPRASTTRRRTATSPRPAGERPPLLVLSHGGPTGATSATLSPSHPVLDQPRLRRARRELRRQHRLRPRLPRAAERQWGIVDVDDCVNGARYLVARGDGRRPAAGDPRRQRRRLHHAGGADLPRRLPGRRQLLRHQRPRSAGDATPTSSSRATSTA